MSNDYPRRFGTPKSKSWHGDIPMGHRYTMGVAGERFYQTLRREGTLTASVHEGAEEPLLPPRLYDPETLAPATDWVTVGPEGTVDTFTLVQEGADAPRVLALVRVDGARGGLVHWIGGCDPGDVSIGMRVRAVLADAGERTGALADIRHFEPA